MAKHYSLDRVLQTEADYIVLFGQRSNGKSYAVKRRCIERAYKNNEKFVYMRRWLEDIRYGNDEKYFSDMEKDDEGNERIKEITGGEYDCISIYRRDIYLAKRDEDGKKVRGKQIGSTVVMTGDTHQKSVAYVGYYRIIFEEMITDKGYLPHEVNTFMSLVSTILRKKKGEVYLIGNTITKQCPFFKEWQLNGTIKQKRGTIDVYKCHTEEKDDNGDEIVITIACEYCEKTSGATRMIFGNAMITSGEWETRCYPHLPFFYSEYRRRLTVYLDLALEKMAIDILEKDGAVCMYVREVDKKWTDLDKYDIIITETFSHEQNYTTTIKAYPRLQGLLRKLYETGKTAYETNLVGSSFQTLLLNNKFF